MSWALLHAAVEHQRGGRLAEAQKLYERVLRSEPKNADALHLLGLVLIERGTTERGFQLLRRAVAYAPRSVEALNNLAVELARAGRVEEALGWFEKALALAPDRPGARPNYASALSDRGIALQAEGRTAEALASFDAAVATAPEHADAHYNRGNTLHLLGRFAEAVAAFECAISLRPGYLAALHNRGISLHALDRPGEALASYDTALAAGSEDPALLVNRAAALLALGRMAEARACCEEALAMRPDDPDALFNLGNALRGSRRNEPALEAYDRALALRPEFPNARDNRGITLLELGRYPEAAEVFAGLIADHPAQPYVRGRLLHARLFTCDWRDTPALSRDVQDRIAAGERVEVPFMALAHVADAALQRRCAEIYVADKLRISPGPAEPSGETRIRLAYLSGDFRNHPLSFLMAGVFERHDRSRFEVLGVSFRPEDDSETGRRVHAAFDRVLDVSRLTDAEAVALLRAERIDVAADLMGHTGDSRTPILAQRIAPVQVAYLGYPGTTAVAAIDWVIADAVVAPPGSEAFYSERIIRLPGCFQANDEERRADPTPTRAEAGLPESGFVFGMFSNTYKILPDLFAIWMRLLAATPGSVLWILASHPDARENLRVAATGHGVDPDRIVFAGRVAYRAHLARLALADLALDTFPFNGGTTTSDALWAGVPMVTCTGEAFASRMGASLLAALGVPDLAVSNLEAYETTALRMAHDPAFRGSKCAVLREARRRSSLFDTEAFTRRLERAYETLANPAVEA